MTETARHIPSTVNELIDWLEQHRGHYIQQSAALKLILDCSCVMRDKPPIERMYWGGEMLELADQSHRTRWDADIIVHRERPGALMVQQEGWKVELVDAAGKVFLTWDLLSL